MPVIVVGVMVVVDEDGGGLELKPERPKKKKKKDKPEEGKEKGKEPSKHGQNINENDDDMWVEKPVAEAVKDMTPSMATPAQPEEMDVEAPRDGGSGPRGRKRAIDFL